jgi:predicted DNA-binding mobile mystery protein A
MKTKPQVVQIFEKNETKGTITLNSMHKIAEAMECKFVYAIVPKTSLQEIIETQAQISAVTMVKRIAHSMNLESQETGEKEEKEHINDIKRKLLDNFSKKLWKHETHLP